MSEVGVLYQLECLLRMCQQEVCKGFQLGPLLCRSMTANACAYNHSQDQFSPIVKKFLLRSQAQVAAMSKFSTRPRAKTIGLGFMWNAFMTWVFTLCVPYMFNPDAGNLGGKVGFVFAGFCVVGFVLSWIDIPEPKDLTYAQLDSLFKEGTPTRRFKSEIAMPEGPSKL